jgi:adenylylsulfate kinase-like enzyme
MRENPLRQPAPMGSDGWVYARSEALFIGGRSGVGKTSAGNEIHAQLAAAGVRHSLIDDDNSAAVVEDVSNNG